DSHHRVHRAEPILSLSRTVAQNLHVPLRHFSSDVLYCGHFYGQTKDNEPYPDGISLTGLRQTLQRLPPGITELGCHPGVDGDVDSIYRLERAQEVEVLCDPLINAC